MGTLQFTLNRTTFTFDRKTGALTELSYPGVRPMLRLDSLEDAAGLCDLAWPVHYEYETLRANPCGQSHAISPRIEGDDTAVILTYEALPQTYDTPEIEEKLDGRVYARIEFRACEDGKSVSMRCIIENRSPSALEQVVFPRFDGLIPTDTKENARLTMMGGVINPYFFGSPRNVSTQFGVPMKIATTGLMLTPSGIQTGPYIGRWYDWGSFEGGFSLYRKHWGWDPENPEKMGEADPIWIRYDKKHDRLTIANVHTFTLGQGETYDSGEYILTAHEGPWIHGAAAYKSWLHQNVHRVVPMPQRAKEMLGFRTINMASYPYDPTDVSCRYSDLPDIAADMAAHGLYDINVWKGFNYTLPITEDCFYRPWGGLPAWNENVQKCRDLGVTVTAFVSWLSLWGETCDNYGIKARTGTWAASPHLLPAFSAPYAKKWGCLQISDHQHPRWAKDVLDGMRFLRDKASCPTISWDQYVLGDHSDNTLHDVVAQYRQETEEMYPGTLWSGESTLFFESELDVTDFTWNGIERTGGRWDWDMRAFMSIVGGMRPNFNVENDPVEVKYALIDNVMLNMSLSDKNGHPAMFSDYPDLSEALRVCWHLRQRYMSCFTNGEALGDCVLRRDSENSYVTGYRTEGKLIVFILKTDDADSVLVLNPAAFLDGEAYTVTLRGEYDEELACDTLGENNVLTVTGPRNTLRIAEISVKK